MTNVTSNTTPTLLTSLTTESDTLITALTADEAVHDLTLVLLYLQRISNNPDNSATQASPAHYWDVTGFKSATSYDPEVMGWLQEVGFVSNYKHPGTSANISTKKSLLKDNSAEIERAEHHVIVTKAGVLRAREILQKLGIQDWDKAEILADADHSASKKR